MILISGYHSLMALVDLYCQKDMMYFDAGQKD